jgi:hypothetical protein
MGVKGTRHMEAKDTVNSLISVKPVAHALPAGLVFGLLHGYAVAVLAADAWTIARRDA